MRSLKHRELAFLLVGSIAAAMPAFAKDGSDNKGTNGSSSNSSSGTSSTSCSITKVRSSSSSSSTSGSSSTSSSSSRSSSSSNTKSKCGFTLNNTLPVLKASFKKTASQKGNKQKLELKLKIGKNGLITQDNFNNDVGSLSAVFPGNIVCEMAGVGQSSKAYTYLLKAKARKDAVEVRVGSCENRAVLPVAPLNAMPVLSPGNPINIVFDADGDVATTTDIVDVGTITFK
jgi:hypothetical protein